MHLKIKSLIGTLLVLSLSLAVQSKAASITTTVCPGVGCVDYTIGNNGSIAIQITGTFSGTITFQSSTNNSTFVSLRVVKTSDATATGITTTTSGGIFQATVTGLSVVRVVFTSWVSGTAIIEPKIVSQAAKFNGGGGGVGSGTVTQVDTTSPILGGPITTTGTISCTSCAVVNGSDILSFVSGGGLSFAGSGANPITALGGDDGFGNSTIRFNNADGFVILKFLTYGEIDPSDEGFVFFSATLAKNIAVFGSTLADNSLSLYTPAAAAVTYDTSPLAALYINGPTVASTRNYASGIAIITNGSAIDKGRGIFIQNLGASDSYYNQLDGVNGTGYAVLGNQAGNVGFVGESRAANTVAYFKQGTGGGTSVLEKIEANIAGTAELIQVSSNQTNKVGQIFRMDGAGNIAITVHNGADAPLFNLKADSGSIESAGYIQTVSYFQSSEMTPPSAPAANIGLIFFQDSGGGKTQACARFNSGAVQCFATEP